MKKVFLVLTTIILFSSTTSFGNSSETAQIINKKITSYEASCFEQGVYFSRWWGSKTGATALERIEVALAYTKECEAAKKPVLQEA